MLVLGIESSSNLASIALLRDGEVVLESAMGDDCRTDETLALAIQEGLRNIDAQPADLNLIAVVQGPGSFTGLRLGVVTAKTLAYATGAALAAVNTLRVIADQAPSEARPLWSIINAYRGQLFCMRHLEGQGNNDAPQVQLLDVDDWLSQVSPQDWLSGPGLSKFELNALPSQNIVSQSHRQPRASTVAKLGLHQFQQEQGIDALALLPKYYRKSAAEEKLETP